MKMAKQPADERKIVQSDDPVHLEKSGLGDHGGLDDSNVCMHTTGLPDFLLTPCKLPRYDDKETKRILRKVDYRLLPVLTLLYVLAFLDRGNIGNAKVAGMNKELKLTGTQYNLALTVCNNFSRQKESVLSRFSRSFSFPTQSLKCHPISF